MPEMGWIFFEKTKGDWIPVAFSLSIKTLAPFFRTNRSLFPRFLFSESFLVETYESEKNSTLLNEN